MFSKIVITLLVVTVAAVAANDEADCPVVCPALYSPTCATDGKIFKEFNNACELKSSNCRLARSALQTYTAIDMDWCTTELVPNLVTALGIDLQKKAECLKPCAMIYQPVCVSNGKIRALVSNKCELEMYNCVLGGIEAPTNLFRILREESC